MSNVPNNNQDVEIEEDEYEVTIEDEDEVIVEKGTKKILIIDDSSVVREHFRDMLKEFDYCLIEAKDGVEGFLKIKENTDLSIAFVDINMPHMDGITLAEKVQESVKANEMPPLPIVMLTTENTKDKVLRCKAAGVKGWIIKPANIAVVSQLIEKVSK